MNKLNEMIDDSTKLVMATLDDLKGYFASFMKHPDDVLDLSQIRTAIDKFKGIYITGMETVVKPLFDKETADIFNDIFGPILNDKGDKDD